MSYDADGNLLADQNGLYYTYDAWNRLTEVYNAHTGDELSYTYDALGRRITETDSNTGITTDNYYSNQNLIEEQQSGTTTGQFVWGPFYVNQLVQQTTSVGTYYVLQNANWDVTSITDASTGGVVERYSYDPNGNATVMNASGGVLGAGLTSSAYGQVIGFQGGYVVPQANIEAFGVRWLVLSLGIWNQPDPIGQDVSGNNLYQLENDNSVKLDDPSGLSPYDFEMMFAPDPGGTPEGIGEMEAAEFEEELAAAGGVRGWIQSIFAGTPEAPATPSTPAIPASSVPSTSAAAEPAAGESGSGNSPPRSAAPSAAPVYDGTNGNDAFNPELPLDEQMPKSPQEGDGNGNGTGGSAHEGANPTPDDQQTAPEQVTPNRLPPSSVKGYIGEQNGWDDALKKEVPTQPPGNTNEPGPDHITLRINTDGTGTIRIYDAKFASGPNTLSNAKIEAWTREAAAAVQNMPDGPLKDMANQALRSGRIEGEIYKFQK